MSQGGATASVVHVSTACVSHSPGSHSTPSGAFRVTQDQSQGELRHSRPGAGVATSIDGKSNRVAAVSTAVDGIQSSVSPSVSMVGEGDVLGGSSNSSGSSPVVPSGFMSRQQALLDQAQLLQDADSSRSSSANSPALQLTQPSSTQGSQQAAA